MRAFFRVMPSLRERLFPSMKRRFVSFKELHTKLSPSIRSDSHDVTRAVARVALILATCAIGIGYASAFLAGGSPAWAAWLLAVGIPVALGAIMTLGAARGDQGLGPLKLPLLFVVVSLAAGFCLALGLPPTEAAGARLFLGLPLRSSIIVYGIGLMPIVVLPLAYALTFKTQTLNESDIERVRELAKKIRDDESSS